MATSHTHNVKDPVCGMDMKPKEVQARSENNGQTYYFCSPTCKEKFDASPSDFIKEPKVA